MAVSGAVLMEKAINLYSHYTEFGGEEIDSFHASKGWFEKFFKWMSLSNTKRIVESAFADHVAGAKYPEEDYTTILEEAGAVTNVPHIVGNTATIVSFFGWCAFGVLCVSFKTHHHRSERCHLLLPLSVLIVMTTAARLS
jgi:hypothetical protein